MSSHSQVVAENAVGLSSPVLSGEVLTRSTIPGPAGRCRGCPEAATINSVKFGWKAPTYTGGEDLQGYEVRSLRRKHNETHIYIIYVYVYIYIFILPYVIFCN